MSGKHFENFYLAGLRVDFDLRRLGEKTGGATALLDLKIRFDLELSSGRGDACS
jgi:hypothetical protein